MMKYISLFLLVLSSNVFAQSETVMKVEPQQQLFTIELPANPTTGYQWSVVNYNKALLRLERSSYIRAETKLIGSGGQMQYVFSLKPCDIFPAQTTLTFKYARPWEKKSGNEKQVLIKFTE